MHNQTIHLNTHTFSASQFINHEFESATIFNGKLYFVNDDGLVSSGGDSDTGGNIEAWIVTPITKMGHNAPKHLRSISVSGDFSGEMTIAVTTDDDIENEFQSSLAPYGGKVALSSKQRGRFFRVKMSNVDGADFNLESADITFIPGVEARK